MPLDSTHPYDTPPVLLAQVRAVIPHCATQPLPAFATATLDDLFDRLQGIDGAHAIIAAGLDHWGVPSDHLDDMQHKAAAACGDPPFYDPRHSIDYVHGGYNERGDGAAWERWECSVEAAKKQAQREFRAKVVAVLRALEGVLLRADARVPA